MRFKMLFFVKREDRRMGVTRMGKTTIFLADDDEGVRRTGIKAGDDVVVGP